METNNTLKNMWSRITLYCLNHENPVEMEILQNSDLIKTPFYACSNYLSTDPDVGRCANRLNLDDYQGIVLKFLDYVAENGPTMDYMNYSFDFKGGRQKTFVKVLKYSDKEIRLGVRNVTVLGK